MIQYMIFESRPAIPNPLCLVQGDAAARARIRELAEADDDEDVLYHGVQVVSPNVMPPSYFA